MLDDDEWMTEREAAAKAGKTVRTMRQWRRNRQGPPWALFGRTIKYRKTAFAEHFRASEINPAQLRKSTTKRSKQAHQHRGA